MIEGYYDPMLQDVMNTPVYMGGNPSISAWISADNMTPTKPMDAMISFMTGVNDYTQTRLVS